MQQLVDVSGKYKDLLLTGLLLLPDDYKSKKYAQKSLSIKEVDQELKIILKPHSNAKKNRAQYDQFDVSTYFWGITGELRDFLFKLLDCSSFSSRNNNKDITRAEGYIATEDKFILYCSLEKLWQEFFYDNKGSELFRYLKDIINIGLLDDISISFKLDNDFEAKTNDLSDGQFQKLYIYALIEFFKNETSLMLLDEPDSFLHPEWQYELLKHVNGIVNISDNNSHILMTSHSPITLIPYGEKKVGYIDIIDNKPKLIRTHKKYTIDQLSSKLLNYREKDKLSVF